VIGLAFRSYRLGFQSLWLDEVLTVKTASLPLSRIVFDPMVDRNFPPLYASLVHVFTGVLGNSESAVRLPSVLAGAISIPLLFAVTRFWLGAAAGLVAAGLLALSPLHIWYSQEARPYALFIALALVSVWFAQRLVRRPELFTQIGFVLSASATLYCHVLALPFLLFLALYTLLCARPGARPHVLLLLGAIGVLTAPQLYQIWSTPPPVSANSSYRFDPIHLGYTLWTFGTGYSFGPSVLELRGGMAALGRHLPLMVPLLGILAMIFVFGARDLWGSDRPVFWSIAAWLTFPVGFAVLGATVTAHPYNVRYVLLSLPAFLIVLATGVLGRSRLEVRLAGMSFLAILSLAALVNYYVQPRYHRDDNRGATAFLNANAERGALVIASAPYTVLALRHYGLRPDLDLQPYPRARGLNPAEMTAGLQRLTEDQDRIWLFLSRTFHSDPESRIERFFEKGFTRELEHAGAGVRVLVYRRQRFTETSRPSSMDR
jgi:4-amino-4-deoxy-L-arabinose transferase-like glycosyltransferase